MREKMYDPEDVFQYILQYKVEHDGNSPGVVEIKEHFNMKSYGTVTKILDQLAEEGKITLGPGARMIYVPGATWNAPTQS